MPLEAKGTIKFELGAKKEIVIKAPSLNIEEAVDGADAVLDLSRLVDALENRIKNKVQEEFARPVTVTLVGYSMSCTYLVDPIKNRTLDEFNLEKDYVATITFPDGKSIETTHKKIALAGKILEKARETGTTPEEVLAAAREKLAAKDEVE